MSVNRTTNEPAVLQVVIKALDPIDAEARERILKYVSDYFGLDVSNGPRAAATQQRAIVSTFRDEREPTFADRATLSPKDFLHEKQPQTDVDRVTCLAYYLTQYCDTPRFKTIDISKLNTEAAQHQFANPAQVVKNAIARGLVAPAGKGARQISAIGERFVDALPDRDDAKAVLGRMRQRRTRKKSSNTKRSRKTNK